MRWGVKPEQFKPGDKRYCFGFLWLPKTIDGETRWLERAEWTEVAHEESVFDGDPVVMSIVRRRIVWIPLHWEFQTSPPEILLMRRRGEIE